jgi:hypothetical protein
MAISEVARRNHDNLFLARPYPAEYSLSSVRAHSTLSRT